MMSAPTTASDGVEAIPDAVLADLRGIQSNRMFAVSHGHFLMSRDMAFWRQSGEIGWHLTEKGHAALSTADAGRTEVQTLRSRAAALRATILTPDELTELRTIDARLARLSFAALAAAKGAGQ